MDAVLPVVDEHQVLVAAPAGAVWSSLAGHLPGAQGAPAAAYARLVAARPRRSSGRLLDIGATLPGFTVVESVPDRYLRLAGQHLFSRYDLCFTLAGESDRTLLTARTLADFPGLRGRLYWLMVIKSSAHRRLMARMLCGVRRDAEGR
ncbi:DUF2867 domain-containing protein [Jiangella asiatica]|uniref:DUF2867 domain-containing protein n=1 Tax=Jiangella asiatica TaxID=2530372 RepID=UPI00193E5383|nr:DUF2867 domain-containing protein [Jiangella asiatica]